MHHVNSTTQIKEQPFERTNSTERGIRQYFICFVHYCIIDRVDIEMHGRVCKFVYERRTRYMLCNGSESTEWKTIHTGAIEHFSQLSYIRLSSSSSLSSCRRFYKMSKIKWRKRIEIDFDRIAHIARHTYVAASKINCKWKPERYSNVSIRRPQWNPIYEEFFVLFLFFYSRLASTNGCSSRYLWNCWKHVVSHLLWVCCFILFSCKKNEYIFVCAATASMLHNFPHRFRHWHLINIRINTNATITTALRRAFFILLRRRPTSFI